MSESFGLVEDKVQEAEFFLENIRSAGYSSFESSYFFSAFVSASRSVTFALQSCMSGVDDFDEWYENARKTLKVDPLAPYFIEIRNDVVHKGKNPYNRVTLDHLRETLFHQFDSDSRAHWLVLPVINNRTRSVLVDAVVASEAYFTSLLSIIYDCYSKFRMVVDPQWYFTEEHFCKMGKTLEDGLDELGFPPAWLSGIPESEAWKVLRRQQPLCPLNLIFEKYLGRVITAPDEELS